MKSDNQISLHALSCHIYRGIYRYFHFLQLICIYISLVLISMIVYQVLTENHVIFWSFGYQHPGLAAEDTQGLPQVQVQLSKLQPSLPRTLTASNMLDKEHSYVSSTSFCGRGADAQNKPFFPSSFSVAIFIFHQQLIRAF